MRKGAWVAAGVIAGSLVVGQAVAESLWVKSERVEIRSGKGAVFPVVGTAAKGAELNVVSREGKWIKVKVGEAEGYVYENALSASKVAGGNNLLAGVGAQAASMTTGSASKGLQPEAETYASAKGFSPAPLNNLIAACKAIDPKEWQAFTAEGNVGPDAPAAHRR